VSAPEVWLRGPVAGVPALLQPVAHALLQAVEDMERVVASLDDERLRRRPGGIASVAFHLRHATGSLDRLCTYALGRPLDDAQRRALAEEGSASEAGAELLADFRARVERAVAQLRATDPADLALPRAIGRAALPTTVIGLLYHAGEHTARHTGQAITTAKAINGMLENP
jgi:hypothetical protein